MGYKIFLAAAFLFSTLSIHDQPLPTVHGPEKFSLQVKSTSTNFWELGKQKSQATDTASLKQTAWYADAIRNIEESEYEIKYDEATACYASPNRQNNLRSFYTGSTFTLLPRNDSADKWKLELTTIGVYSHNKLIYAPAKNAVASLSKKAISFSHENNFATEYINSTEGVRQNFIIQKEPVGKPQSISLKLAANKNWLVNKVHNKEIHFAKATKTGYDNKIIYNSLKVWDADNKELDASFEVAKNEISIHVNTAGAVYPITIDPLSTIANWTVESNTANARLGNSVAPAGDVNGDGYSDVIVGAPYFNGGQVDEGKVFVYLGSITGLSTTASWSIESNQASANLGMNAATAGDVNGDGFSDVIVGAPNFSNGQTGEGRAYVYYGSVSGLALSPAWTNEINQASAQYGRAVASAGDVNGDGFSDVIVGAPFYDNGNTDEGGAFVYYGSGAGLPGTANWTAEGGQDGALFGGTQSSAVGTGVASAGDVNGDGFSDVIIAATGISNGNTLEGKAFVYHGSAGGLLVGASWSIEGNQDFAFLGNSLASAGDANGDGYSDVIVGVHQYDNGEADEGRAYAFYGSAGGLSVTANWTMEINLAGAIFGCSVASAGDVNGDGYADVIVGASFYSNGEGAEGGAFVYYGSSTGLSLTYNWQVESNIGGTVFGIMLSSAGDVNGDGYSDVIVGAAGYSNPQSLEGAAFAFYGGAAGLSAAQTHTLSPENQNQAGIGNAVAGAGDVNGDGYSDVIIGAFGYDDGASTDEGRAWVYYGSATGLSATPDVVLDDANQAFAYFGYSVASAGDVNGDGYADVVVGGYGFDDGSIDEGRAWVHYGSAAGLSALANRVLDNANQTGALFGVSVSTAGDVNGDGYSDVIVGAYSYNATFIDEGIAYVYYGSVSGLSVVPNSTPDDAGQGGSSFGGVVACAGDVNGDGYSDVAVCAGLYDDNFTDEGVVFIYYGSATGLSASPNAILDDGNQAGAAFGRLAACAGDVNGDGFADVLVTSIFYDSEKGRGWVYYGSAVGLSATPDVILDNTAGNAGDRLSYGASPAGDVNGDGYSDVILGIPQCTVAFPQDGKAYIYYGSAAGLVATPGTIIHDATETHEFFGLSTACAGDINGDGYSDVIVGADHGSWPSAFGGRAYVHTGNDLVSNKRNNLRLYNSNLTTPINSSNFIIGNFGAGLYAKSFLSKAKGKMVWETRLNYNAYSGNPITNSTSYTAQQSAYTDLGLAGVELKNIVNKILGTSRYTKLRARVKYDPATAITGQVYGPWRNVSAVIDGNSLGALPIELISFNAAWLQKGKAAQINFVTDKENGICCFDIEKSADGFNFSPIGTISARNTAGRQTYNFIDNNANAKTQYYRLKIKGIAGQVDYSNMQQLQNKGATEILVFPNPATNVLQLQLNKVYDKMTVQVVNAAGQIVKQLNIAAPTRDISIPVNNLPAGQYWLRLESGSEKQVLQFVKQ